MLRIELIRKADGTGTLRCTRADGSVTWQKRERHAEFFAHHDLTHFAVESVLQSTEGFFGLVAAGWDIEDTTGKGARGPIPQGAVAVERLVGLLDQERASGTLWTPDQFREQVTSQQLAEIRNLRSKLFSEWSENTTLVLRLP